MSSHIPINHHLLPLYRTLAGLAGLFCLVFGIVGVIRTASDPMFHRGDVVIFGLKTDLGFAIISIVIGAIVLVGALLGGNLDHYINLFGGIVFLVVGMLMLALLQTNANFLNFRIGTCIVSFIIGTFLLTAGLYGRVGDASAEAHEDNFRLHHGDDPDNHKWKYHGAPPRPAEDHPDGHRFA
jgi:hypothetical protein